MAMFGMRGISSEERRMSNDPERIIGHSSHRFGSLSGTDGVPHDVVHRELDEFRPLLTSALSLGIDLGEPARVLSTLARIGVQTEMAMSAS